MGYVREMALRQGEAWEPVWLREVLNRGVWRTSAIVLLWSDSVEAKTLPTGVAILFLAGVLTVGLLSISRSSVPPHGGAKAAILRETGIDRPKLS